MIKKIIFLFLLPALITLSSSSQATYSGYFLDNFLYRHQMNPAMGNVENFVGFPGLGNLSVNMQGNIHLSKILYNIDGRTVLFTNPGVSLDQVGTFHNKNRLGILLRENILNGGFKAWGGYNTIGINIVSNSHVGVPGSLFNMLKEGIRNQTYEIDNLRVKGNVYAEIALNHSRDLDFVPGLRVGATFKFLVGGANIDGRFRKAHMELGEDSWNIISDAEIQTSLKGLKYKTDYNSNTDQYYVSGVDFNNIGGPTGYGGAIDLGATYEWSDFNFSLAILDIGGIRWNETQLASTNGQKTFQTSKYTFDISNDDNNDGKSEWDKMKDDVSSLYQLENMGDSGGRSTMLGATLNIGAEYEFPYYRPLHFGFLNSTRINGSFSWTEFRLSANVMPVKYVSASANVVAGTFGVGFGWILNVTSGKGFNLFVGMDRIPGKLAKQYVPLNSNMNFNFGINFPF